MLIEHVSCEGLLMAIGTDGRWYPAIGDPSIGGWVTVAGYLGAACLAYRALRLHHTGQDRSTSPDQRVSR